MPDSPHRSSTLARPSRAPDRGTEELEDAFVDWLLDPEKPGQLHLDGPGRPPFPLTRILGALATSSRRLPASAAAMLGLAGGTSIGAAATALLLAVKDPAGPRCRSYRSASDFLRKHHELMVILDEL